MKTAEEKLRAKLHKLLTCQKLGVLSTHDDGQPYGSLIAFAVSDDLKHIVFATPRASRKYANMSSDSRVSFVVENTINSLTDFRKAMGVTVLGRVRQLRKNPNANLMKLYLEKHENLADFALSKDCALMCIDVKSYHVVEKFQQLMDLYV